MKTKGELSQKNLLEHQKNIKYSKKNINLKNLLDGAKRGEIDAQFELGTKYKNGTGVPQDFGQAVYWLRRAAVRGHILAQYNLGWMYDHGCGVSQDSTQAAYWYGIAAEQGNAFAQNMLGSMYEQGHGLAQNIIQAVNYYCKTADQGNTDTLRNIQRIKNMQNYFFQTIY